MKQKVSKSEVTFLLELNSNPDPKCPEHAEKRRYSESPLYRHSLIKVSFLYSDEKLIRFPLL